MYSDFISENLGMTLTREENPKFEPINIYGEKHVSTQRKRAFDRKHEKRMKDIYKNSNEYMSICTEANHGDKIFYKRTWMSNGKGSASRFLKKRAHKKIRQYNGEFPSKGNCCQKIFDYWWEIC